MDIRATLDAGGAVLLEAYEGEAQPWATLQAGFEVEASTFEGCRLLLACYDCPDYEGQAFILYEQGGLLYEVNANHCSCFGLEGQWEPEETSVVALRYRLDQGYEGRSYDKNIYADELRAVLAWFEGQAIPEATG
jgi:hypothetical protein